MALPATVPARGTRLRQPRSTAASTYRSTAVMQYTFGPSPDATGTTFRLWAPSRKTIQLAPDQHAALPMQRRDDGLWELRVEDVKPGARYRIAADGHEFPDPASRQQDGDADGWSLVRGPSGLPRHAGPLRPWHETILCEVHVGTASPE